MGPTEPPDLPPPPPTPEASGRAPWVRPAGFAIPDAPPPPARRRRLLPLVAGGTVFALVAGALAVVFTRGSGSGQGGPPIALALSFTQGQLQTYNTSVAMNLTLSSGGQSVPVSSEVRAPESIRVVSTGSRGAAVIVRLGPMTVSSSGQSQNVPAQAIRLQIAPDGRIVSGGGLVGGLTQAFGGGSGLLPGGQQIMPLLPDHKVAPGQSWDTPVNRSLAAIGSGSVRFTAHSTFLRYTRVGGVRSAMIESRATIPMNFTIDLSKVASRFGTSSGVGFQGLTQGTIRYSGSVDETITSWLDLPDRRLERMNTNGTFHVQFAVEGLSGATSPTQATMTGTMNFVIQRAG